MLSIVSNTAVKNVPFKYSAISCTISSLVHHYFFGYSMLQSNLASVTVIAVVHFVVLFNILCLLNMTNLEIVKSLISLLTMPKLCAFLVFGVLWHSISMSSSSFIEEEHQTWYYFNSTIWIILYIKETKHLLKRKTEKNMSSSTEEHESLFQNQMKWALLFGGHLIARRLNQTGDKWLNTPDIGDWLQSEENRIWNSLFMSSSLLCVYLTCMDFGSILTNVLTLTACMLIYYYRTLNGSVYFAGIKASG